MYFFDVLYCYAILWLMFIRQLLPIIQKVKHFILFTCKHFVNSVYMFSIEIFLFNKILKDVNT